MRKLNRRFSAGTVATLIVSGAVLFAQKQATIFVTVVAPSSGPVAGLTAKDFVVQGGKAEVKDVVHADEPLAVEILVDVSRPPVGVTPPIQDLRTALQSFVQKLRSAESSARIGLTQVSNAAVPAVTLGAPATELDKAIGTIAPGPDMSGSAVMMEGLQDASHTLAEEPAPRRAVVSVDFGSSDSFPDTRVNGLAKDVFKTGVSVWAISVRPAVGQTATNGSTDALYNVRDNAYNSIIKTNGGLRMTIVAATGLKEQLQIVANSLLSQYELTIAGVDAAHARDLKIATSGGAKVIPSVFAR